MRSNVIPPITEPMGKHWRQPSTESIQVDDTHALMGKAEFDQLSDYSCTNPSGVYPGKMWRRSERGEWYLVWFGVDKDPAFCSINYRKILLA